MHPLAFSVSWLLGAASTGGDAAKRAREALSLVYPSLTGDLSWSLEQLRAGVVNNQALDIDNGLQGLLGGFRKNQGESCTDCIIRSVKTAQGEYAARAVSAACMTLPPDKLLPTLKDMVAVLEKSAASFVKPPVKKGA